MRACLGIVGVLLRLWLRKQFPPKPTILEGIIVMSKSKSSRLYKRKIISTVWEMCLLHTNWAHVVLRTVLELCLLTPCALLSNMFLHIPVFLGWCQGSLGLSVKNSNNAPLKKISVHFLHTRQLLMELFTTKWLRFNHYMEKKSWNEKKRCRTPKEWLLALN